MKPKSLKRKSSKVTDPPTHLQKSQRGSAAWSTPTSTAKRGKTTPLDSLSNKVHQMRQPPTL
uniref:Uncharacterized protein n=1 Tax=Rhizophora mucronata TaxID=61149 RepID=A0A2P2JZ06_RHIMU